MDSTDLTHMLHHSQLAFPEQAFRPVPQENLLFVEQAGKPVADNGATSQFNQFNNYNLLLLCKTYSNLSKAIFRYNPCSLPTLLGRRLIPR